MYKLFVFSCVILTASAGLIDIRPCDLTPEQADKCTISNLSIEPCTNKKICQLRTGTNTEISFTYTPHFSANRLQNEVVYLATKFEQITADACTSTTCPVVAENSYNYNYTLYLNKKLPTGIYTFDWKLMDEANSDNICCALITIRLKRH